MSNKYIRASEIGDYVFCKRGWWLRFNGLLAQNEQMVEGIKQHDSLFSKIQLYKLLIRIGWGILIFGVLLFIILVVYIITLL